ncbi:MAG: helix-turn-helix transcriptional regulator [Bacillota bacterium]
MPTIHETLKTLRQARGLTQEAVARQIGVTRQTISSYESGRTQPDIETLKRFAEIYDVGFNDILYGTNRIQQQRRRIKILAAIALIDLLVCNAVQAVLIWTANTYFRLEPGLITEALRPIFEARKAILNVHTAVEWFSLLSFRLCGIVLFIFLIRLERPIVAASKLKYLAMLVLGAALTTLPPSLFDPAYSFHNYSFTATINILFALVLFGLSFIGEHFYQKKKAAD